MKTTVVVRAAAVAVVDSVVVTMIVIAMMTVVVTMMTVAAPADPASVAKMKMPMSQRVIAGQLRLKKLRLKKRL